MDLRLPADNSATKLGLKAGLWGFLGTAVTLAIALWTALAGVPGCSETVLNFFRDHFLEIAGATGVTSGILRFITNWIDPKVKNY